MNYWLGTIAVGIGLFALTQVASAPTEQGTPIRFWSHGLHLGMVALFFLRARHVLYHELIVGNVGVEGSDQVVAVLVGVRHLVVKLVSVRFRVPHQIHPVSRPLFAKVR